MRVTWRLILGVCCILTAAAYLYLWYPVLAGSDAGPAQDAISLGIMPDESSALVYIAEERGYFADRGINLTITYYPNGAAAIRGMENGDVNLTLSSEFPLVAEIMSGRKILIAGSVDKYYGTDLVARRDRGIASPTDLTGKTIAVSKNSVGEFYLGRFLSLHGIPAGNITFIDIPADGIIARLSNNSGPDAAVTTPLNSYRLTSQSPERYVVFPILNGQATYKVVAGNRDWIQENPRGVARFLGALHDASGYAAANPDQARALVVRRVNVSEGYLRNTWPGHQYTLSFDQSLLLAMEDEARWMIRNNRTPSEEVPDFLGSFYTSGMKTAEPEAVQIAGRGDRP